MKPQPGDTLNNGATVIKSKEVAPEEYVVLAERGGYHPYVTWRMKSGACFWGHYHRYPEKAIADFHKRVLTSARI